MPPNCRQLTVYGLIQISNLFVSLSICQLFLHYFIYVLFFSVLCKSLWNHWKNGEENDCVVEAQSSWLVLQMPTKKKRKIFNCVHAFMQLWQAIMFQLYPWINWTYWAVQFCLFIFLYVVCLCSLVQSLVSIVTFKMIRIKTEGRLPYCCLHYCSSMDKATSIPIEL